MVETLCHVPWYPTLHLLVCSLSLSLSPFFLPSSPCVFFLNFSSFLRARLFFLLPFFSPVMTLFTSPTDPSYEGSSSSTSLYRPSHGQSIVESVISTPILFSENDELDKCNDLSAVHYPFLRAIKATLHLSLQAHLPAKQQMTILTIHPRSQVQVLFIVPL
jgi:hypothetical protein